MDTQCLPISDNLIVHSKTPIMDVNLYNSGFQLLRSATL